ncbi:MAG: tetratricopeptide repeat protein [Deltaproteobacteria bacterium]
MSSNRDDDLDVDQLSTLAKHLDAPAPDDQRVEAMRASLLRAAADDRREVKPRWPFVVGGFSAGAFAAAATVMMVVHFSHGSAKIKAAASEEHRAQIEASAAADFEREVTHGANGTDEVVRLHAGRISVAVSELPHGDRVRVAAKDGELEGEGTYEIAVTKDSIREVWVKEGSARLRIAGQEEVFLASGQAWKAPVITADVTPAITQTQMQTQPPATAAATSPTLAAPPSHVATNVAATTAVATNAVTTIAAPTNAAQTPTGPAASKPPTNHVADGPRISSGTPKTEPAPKDQTKPEVPPLQTMADASPNEAPSNAIAQLAKAKPVTGWQVHFSTGWQLLRAGKSADAARELAAAADAGGDDPLAGDARYFEAVALTKAGRKTEAEHALVAFLDRAPHALRRGRAAVMLGRLIAERGDTAAARTWFDSAAHDADPAVATAAKAGLAGLK